MSDEPDETSVDPPKQKCGIVMPISTIDGCDESHWGDVRGILSDAIGDTELFEPNLVSDSDDIGIIQKRIIQNLYDNPMVVCDVSGKNPNVMFELGIRLAFDKPTIIVKDDKTSYSFDTSPIEHLEYPRDLRFSQIVDFKSHLASRISATHKAATSDPQYTTFLKHFGTFTVAKLESKEISSDELIIEEIRNLRSEFVRSRSTVDRAPTSVSPAEFNEAFTETDAAILEYLKLHGLKRKVDIRNAKEEICNHVLRKIHAPSYFPTLSEFEQFFDTVFSVRYG